MFRLIALHLPTVGGRCSERRIGLGRERVDYRVHSSPCALHHAVRDVFRGNRRVFRHVPRRANRPGLNAANANAQREKY